METNVKIIEKWYKALNFSKKFDEEFYLALKNFRLDETLTFEKYDLDEQDGKKNLLYFLYFCEQAQKDYDRAGMSREVFLDTFTDIVRWTEIWSEIKGELYLGELCFLQYHFKLELFKIGRLEYFPKECYFDIPELGVKKGDTVLTVHIPKGEKLTTENCETSLRLAREFYCRHFPDKNYKCFVCTSWLLDLTLQELLPPESGIMQFQSVFKPVCQEKADKIFHYVFRWDATRENFEQFPVTSSFAERVKDYALLGKDFHIGGGFVKF